MALTIKQQQMLDRAQTMMVAKMMRLNRRVSEGEDWIEWSKRKIRTARFMITHHSHGYVSTHYLAKYWQWAGHVARMDPGRWAYRATSWWSLRWKSMAVADHFPVYRKEFQWKMRGSARKKEKYCWDIYLHKFGEEDGCSWWSLARDRVQWKAHEYPFVEFTKPFDGIEISENADIADAQYTPQWNPFMQLHEVG